MAFWWALNEQSYSAFLYAIYTMNLISAHLDDHPRAQLSPYRRSQMRPMTVERRLVPRRIETASDNPRAEPKSVIMY